ncbi:hypothetical protein B0H17DRAFT_427375 [Mycena rosella]|uniref:Uncharacterized protein n=1 Tax=Mycena rosella TaxID=1033263 RepID=A0AAD7DQ42_MYCRO|nr:hypothetical protein B0H17DRAFT_427375 [Mycena rosella]
MPGMSVLWLVLLASRVAHADFHFLSYKSSGVSATPIPTNPTLAVPTSDMAGCDGILGPQMVTLQNLTQPVGTASVFNINDFCGASRLDVYLRSSDLLAVYIAGGDGTQLGVLIECIPSLKSVSADWACSPSSPKTFNCSEGGLQLDCTDSWTCFSGICEAPREGSATTPSPVSATSSGSSLSSGSSPSSKASSSSPSTSSTQRTPSAADNSPAQAGGRSKGSRTATVVGSVLGALCLCLALIVALLIWRRRRTGAGRAAVRPFVATQSSQASPFKSAGPPISISPAELPLTAADLEGAEARHVQGRSRAVVMSWRTLPPSYSHRGEGEDQGG